MPLSAGARQGRLRLLESELWDGRQPRFCSVRITAPSGAPSEFVTCHTSSSGVPPFWLYPYCSSVFTSPHHSWGPSAYSFEV